MLNHRDKQEFNRALIKRFCSNDAYLRAALRLLGSKGRHDYLPFIELECGVTLSESLMNEFNLGLSE